MGALYNRARETNSASGTTDFTLTGAVSGNQTFEDAGVSDGETITYVAENLTGTEWEIGEGVYTTSTNVLTRATILDSSNAGAIVSFTTAPEVFIDAAASDILVLIDEDDMASNSDSRPPSQQSVKAYVDNNALEIELLDDISSGFDGSTTAFSLLVSSQAITPDSAQNLLIALGGVWQEAGTAYTISSSTITFTTAPAAGTTFHGIHFAGGTGSGGGGFSDVGVPAAASQITGAATNYTVTTTETAVVLDTVEIDGSGDEYDIDLVANTITFDGADGSKVFRITFNYRFLLTSQAVSGSNRSYAVMQCRQNGSVVSWSTQWHYIREWAGGGNNGDSSTGVSMTFLLQPALDDEIEFTVFGVTASGAVLTVFQVESFTAVIERVE